MQATNNATKLQNDQEREEAHNQASEFGQEWDELEASIKDYCQHLRESHLSAYLKTLLASKSKVI